MTGIYLFNSDRKPTEIEHLTKDEFMSRFKDDPDALHFLYGVMQRIADIESELIDIGVISSDDED